MNAPDTKMWFSVGFWIGLLLLAAGLVWCGMSQNIAACGLLLAAGVHAGMILLTQQWALKQPPETPLKLRDVAAAFWFFAAGLSGVIFAMAYGTPASKMGPWLALFMGIWVTYRTTLLGLQFRGWATPVVLHGAMRQMQGNLMFLTAGVLVGSLPDLAAGLLFGAIFLLAPVCNVLDKKRW